MRITRTLTTAIAIGALAAPAAQARPVDPAQRDMHASVAIAAAQQQRPLGHAGDTDWNAIAAPVLSPRQVTQAPVVAADDDGGVPWSTFALIAGGLLAVGAVAALAGRRHPRPRVTV